MPLRYLASRDRMGGAVTARLTNGMRLIVMEDRRSPVAVCNLWVRVGSNLEPDGVRGWAHGIEHLLFKGTARRAEGDFAREVADLGGTTNAGTGYETTNYHITVPAEHLPAAVDILHDALFHSTFEPAALDAERQVLVHENHMYDDQPSGFGVTWRWGLELARDASPYRHPIGGRDEDLLSTPRERIVDFWRAAYQPDRVTAVVVGDVEAGSVLDLLAATFGPEAPPRPYDLPTPACEPPHDRLRARLARGDLQRVYGKLLLPGVAESDPDQPALAVVQQILSDGRSARLYRRIQEGLQLVGGIGLLSESGPREGLLVVDFETDAANVAAAVAEIGGLLQEMKDAPPDENELDRARIRTERGHAFGLETVQGRAANLGWHDAMGDPRAAFDWPQRVAAVTGADVQRLCRRLFVREEAAVLVYAPANGGDDGIPADAAAWEALLAPRLGGRADGTGPAPTSATVAPTGMAAVTPAIKTTAKNDRPFEEILLRGGLRLYVREDRSLPVATLSLYAAGGVCHQAPGREGLAHLTQQVQAKATAREDAAALHAAVESCGASLSPFSARDHTGLSLTGLTARLDPLLERLGRLACAPAFPADELEQERRLALDDLQAQQDDPFQAAARALRAAMYPDHPYGSPMAGTEASLPGLTRDDLVAHHARLWTSRNVHVVVSGDVKRDRLAARIETILGDLPDAPSPPLPPLDRVPAAAGVERQRLGRDVRQSVVLCGWRGPLDPNTDRAALALLQSLLNGQSGRLFEALRNRRSLCYTTGMQAARGFAPGMLVGYVLTDPSTEAAAAAALVEELRRVAAEPAAAAEFARARARLLGNLLISRQSNAARASRCGADVLYGRAPNNIAHHLKEIRALTPRRVRDAAARYLGADDHWETVLGPD
ncbi:MAG: hypothetical protein C0395_00770 [Gemmatimonas sp.]|nr:hypothetical protein [Gemmatimonas sp.]